MKIILSILIVLFTVNSYASSLRICIADPTDSTHCVKQQDAGWFIFAKAEFAHQRIDLNANKPQQMIKFQHHSRFNLNDFAAMNSKPLIARSCLNHMVNDDVHQILLTYQPGTVSCQYQ